MILLSVLLQKDILLINILQSDIVQSIIILIDIST